jgi:glutathione peroxidase
MEKTIYDFTVQDADGKEKSLMEYEGKVLLIVNTASKCGFTPQFEGLQTVHDQYKDKGLEILAFPCNQFMNQEPLNEKEIAEFCSANYNISFPLMKKIDVNGKNASPAYNFLKKKLPGALGIKSIKWNFTKFLVSRSGVPVKRYAPSVAPEKLTTDIEKLLSK